MLSSKSSKHPLPGVYCNKKAFFVRSPQVLGTLITEWEGGEALCARLFADAATAERHAEQLVLLAKTLGFEGWLVNIENALTGEQVEVALHFVRYLKRRMHEEVPHALVVWCVLLVAHTAAVFGFPEIFLLACRELASISVHVEWSKVQCRRSFPPPHGTCTA